MPKDFLPSKDSELLPWGTNFGSKITATPLAFGVQASQCAALATLFDLYSDKLAICSNPSTRTRESIGEKDDSRAPYKSMVRELARIINAFPGTTNPMRVSLGLNERSGQITPQPVPTEQPVLKVKSVINRTIQVQLQGQDTTRRGKPANVAGCSLFTFVGSQPPADVRQYVYEGSTTRTTFDVELPSSVPAGSQVWIVALWKNARDIPGPLCYPVSAFIAGGVTSGTMSLSGGTEELKEAA